MSDGEVAWEVGYGNGGWVCVTSSAFAGWLYLRLAIEDGRPRVVELYLDGQGAEVTAKLLRELPLANLVAWICEGEGDGEDGRGLFGTRFDTASPDLSRLAVHFSTFFTMKSRHWVADSMHAQMPGSGVPQAPRGGKPRAPVAVSAPEPLAAPDAGLTDEFLRSVASNYAWAVRRGRRPAPALADMAKVSPRTVHGWVRKARDRGIMPATRPGRTS